MITGSGRQLLGREDAQTGVNLPPMHPNCRSIDTAWFDDEDYDRLTRIATDPVTGEVTEIPRSMKYPEWIALQKEKYGQENVTTAQKMARNRKADKAQYKRYQERLGKEHMPDTFEAFQATKYAGGAAYAQMGRAYRTIGEIQGKENWSEAFRQKTITGYWTFREKGVEMSSHALSRYYDPGRSNEGTFSVDDFVALYRRGSQLHTAHRGA